LNIAARKSFPSAAPPSLVRLRCIQTSYFLATRSQPYLDLEKMLLQICPKRTWLNFIKAEKWDELFSSSGIICFEVVF